MTGSVTTPRFDLELDTISFRVMGGFEVAPALYVDGGVRRLALDMTATVLNFQPVNWKPGIWEPVVGMSYRPLLGRKLRLFTQADIGFTTDDSSRSADILASIEWKPISHMSLGAGWGWAYARADGTILTKAVHLRIPVMLNGDSGHRDHRFRSSRSLIGAKRRRQRVGCASFACRVASSYVFRSGRQAGRRGPCGPLWAARPGRRPSRGGNRALGDFHAGDTVHRRYRRKSGREDAPRSTIGLAVDRR